jgi:ribose transport system permease protein
MTANTPTAIEDGDLMVPRVGARLLKIATGYSSVWILLALGVISLVFSVMRPDAFATTFNWTNIAINASSLLILAAGQTFVIATSGVDLSVGSVLVFSSVIAAQTTISAGVALGNPESSTAVIIGLLAGLVSGLAWGIFNGFLVAVAKVPPLIVTLGSLGMALGFAEIMTGGNDVRGLPAALTRTVGSGRLFGVIPWLVIIAVIIATLAALLLNTTKFGRYTLAIGSDEEASRRNAIPVRLHLVKIYAMSGLLAGLTGWLSIARFGATTINGHASANLDTIAGTVLGGTSLFGGVATIFGTVVGVFIPTVLQNGFTIIGVLPFWQNVAVGAVLIAAVYYDQRRRKARSRR